jgi:Zn-dependent membrane protease YugP
MPIGLDPRYFLFMMPAILLMMWAQWRVKSAFHYGMRIHAPLSGAAAARYILDQSGLHSVGIEEVPGELSDHYDPSDRVLRLSSAVYHTPSAAAVGIAAHEAGHALQHAHGYAPLTIRNLAVPAATYGPHLAMAALFLGLFLQTPALILGAVIGFGAVLAFQVINLPVEFDASARAKRLLREMNIVDSEGASAVSSVLNAAAWTYVAGTLQTLLQVLYYLMIFLSSSRRNGEGDSDRR